MLYELSFNYWDNDPANDDKIKKTDIESKVGNRISF